MDLPALQKKGIKTIDHNGETYFSAASVGTTLKINNIHMSMSSIHNDHKISIIIDTPGGPQRTTWIDITAFKALVARSRSTEASSIATLLGFDIANYRVVPAETGTIEFIIEAFANEKYVLQHTVGNKRIDLYFPDYNLAIECDERPYHSGKKKLDDVIRQQHIEQSLQCTFKRYEAFSKDPLEIARLINKIHMHICDCKSAAYIPLKTSQPLVPNVYDAFLSKHVQKGKPNDYIQIVELSNLFKTFLIEFNKDNSTHHVYKKKAFEDEVFKGLGMPKLRGYVESKDGTKEVDRPRRCYMGLTISRATL